MNLDLSAAIEAAAQAKWAHDVSESDIGWGPWDEADASSRSLYLDDMRAALEAAAPHIVAQAFFLYYKELGDTPAGHAALYEWQKISRTLPKKPVTDPYDQRETPNA